MTDMLTKPMDKDVKRFLFWTVNALWGILLTIGMMTQVYIINQINEHDSYIAEDKAVRFTHADWSKENEKLNQRFLGLPPISFKEKVDRNVAEIMINKTMIERTMTVLNEMKVSLARIESNMPKR